MLRLALLACAAGQYAIDDIVHAPPSAPGAPVVVTDSVTSRSLVLRWSPVDDPDRGLPDYYAIQQTELFARDAGWVDVATRVGAPAEAGAAQTETQVVSIVPPEHGGRVVGGYFRLALAYGGVHVESEAAAARFTPPIAFDAGAAELAAALESLENVQHVKVRRCDEMGGLGGAGGWLGGCAHADRGALSWLLTFEAPGANRALDARASVAEVRTRAS